MKKRILSLLLALVMVLGMFPVSAMATDNSVTVGFTVIDAVSGKVEYMRKELTVTPRFAVQYFDDAQYGNSSGGIAGFEVEVPETAVTPIDVLVAAHVDKYGDDFTKETAGNYITGFDYVSKIFGSDSEITWSANGIMPYLAENDEKNTFGYDIGYAINQYTVQDGDEICFYRMSYSSYPANLCASFDKPEAEVEVGEDLTLKLGFCAVMGYVDDPIYAPNAEIYALNEDGTVGDKITDADANGNVTVSFDTAGTYYLTCKGEVNYYDTMMGFESTGALSPAYCKVTVTEEESNTPLPVVPYEIDATLGGSFKKPNSNYYIEKVTVTGPEGIMAHDIDRSAHTVGIYLADSVPEDAEYEVAFSQYTAPWSVSYVNWKYSGDLGDTGTGSVRLENGTKTVSVTTDAVYFGRSNIVNWKLEFKPYVAPTSVTLNKSELELDISYSETLTATIAPEDSSVKSVTWTSSDDEIATVSSSGDVTGKAAGTATITATAGDKSASCTVTVKYVDVTAVTLNKNEMALALNNSEKLTATISPDNASDKTVTWASSNEEVATVDSSGKVTAVAVGEAVITAAACNGEKATCTVTVSKTTPGLKDGVSAEVDAYVGVNETYELKLTEQGIFVDRDGDTLSYTVSVDGTEAVEANGTWYSYTPTTVGVHTLVFKCKDSDGNEAADTYTVKVHAVELKGFDTATQSTNDSWNPSILHVDIGGAKTIVTDDDSCAAYVLLDNGVKQGDAVYFVAKFHNYRNVQYMSMTFNGQRNTSGKIDLQNYIWKGTYIPEWNDKGEAEVVMAIDRNNSGWQSISSNQIKLRLKLSSAENAAPALSGEATGTGSVMQYSNCSVDVKSLFTDSDDSWLLYSAAIGDGEFVTCGESYVFNSKTSGEKVLKFKAADLAGKESAVYTLTMDVTDYVTPEGSFYIGDTTEDGAVLDVTFKDNNGNIIEGVAATVGEKVEEDETAWGYTYKVWRRIIDVTLPGNEGQVGTSDKIKAYFHLTQTGDWPWFTAGGSATGHTDNKWDAQKTDTITTKLSGGVATGYGYMYETEPTIENNEHYIYELRYHIERENNQAPMLKAGYTPVTEVTKEQYESYTINAKDVFSDPEGDALTYYISVDNGAFEELTADGYGSVNRTFELSEAGTTKIVLKAEDALGAETSCTIYLTATAVLRYAIETGENAGTFVSGVNKIFLYGVGGERFVLSKDGSNREIVVQLKQNTADDAEIDVRWEYSADSITVDAENPVKLVDGKAEFTIETHGNVFDSAHKFYKVIVTTETNSEPVLAEGVEAGAAENVLIGEAYELDLSTIFTDADSDELTYTVSINDAEAVSADAEYSYTPEALGAYTLVFRAADKWGTAEASYTVALTAKNSDTINLITFKVPEGITPTFYASVGFDNDYQDILGTELGAEKGSSADGRTTYIVSVPDNIRRVSFRGVEGKTAWGGMSVAVKDYEDKVITAPFVLRQLEGIINTKLDDGAAPTAGQAVFRVKYGEGAYAVSGGSFNDQYGNLGYRFLLLAADNSLIYTYYATPLGELADTYAESQGDIKTVTGEVATKATAVMKLANTSAFSITAPTEATVQFFRQIGNYNVTELQPYETINNNDGTKTVVFNSNGGMFRVSMEGKITKAGYCDGDSVTINWDGDDRGPDFSEEYDVSASHGNRGNDSTYVNINYRNNLLLDVDETFRLRAYRLWQIINTDTANIMIEPDFHYNVVSGSDVISIAPSENCSGNAKNNWLDIKGLKEGTAIIEITYDALHLVSNGSGDQGGILAPNNVTYNAVDPARTALVVVQVGAESTDIDFGVRNNAGNVWDAEHDTLCFTGDSAELKFSPTAASGSISKVEISGNKGASWTELSADNGEYTASIVHGNNIIRITKNDGAVSYQIVRGYKLTIVVSEVDGKSDMDGTIEAGETVSVWLKGYHNPIGKMSGIYNMQSTTLCFTVNGQQISRVCGAYGFYADARINVTVPGTAQNGDTVVLEDGYATTAGFGSGGGAHRAITGEVPPNLDADTVGGGYNIYGDIVITVGASAAGEIVDATGVTLNTDSASVEKGKSITLSATVTPANAADKTVTWTSSDTSVATVSASGKVVGVSEGTVTITAAAGEYSDTCTVTVTEATGGDTPGGNSGLEFGLSRDEILGYVTVSFEDNGIRKSDELSGMDAEFRNPLGTIISATRVPFKAYDTIASVTLRLLEEKGFCADYEGDEYSSFYLAAIGDFTHCGTYYSSFGEFDAGADSGWMITWDNWFINKGASEFMVENGDIVRWQYTCRLGADIGDNDWMDNTGGTGTGAGADTSSEDRAAARAVKGLIEAIGTVTKDSGPAIESARTAYDALTDAQKDLVPNYDDLVTAEKKYAELTKDETKMVFTDVSESDYYYEAVKWAVELGITNGTSDTAFSPNASCTRAQMVTFLWRAAGEPKAKSTACVFTDVDQDACYCEALLWAVENGITGGTGATTFSPDATCTRGQMATFLYRDAKAPVVSGNHAFDDVKADVYYNDAVIWAAARGITVGTGDTTFSPDADCTRGQMVTFLYRYLAK